MSLLPDLVSSVLCVERVSSKVRGYRRHTPRLSPRGNRPGGVHESMDVWMHSREVSVGHHGGARAGTSLDFGVTSRGICGVARHVMPLPFTNPQNKA